MSTADIAGEIVRRAEQLVGPDKKSLTPEQVEQVMRPLADHITFETREAVQSLVRKHESLRYCLDHWIEAHIAVTGRGPAERVDFVRNFLLIDRCECVLVHLPAAIAHHRGDIDDRVRRALEMGPGVG